MESKRVVFYEVYVLSQCSGGSWGSGGGPGIDSDSVGPRQKELKQKRTERLKVRTLTKEKKKKKYKIINNRNSYQRLDGDEKGIGLER